MSPGTAGVKSFNLKPAIKQQVPKVEPDAASAVEAKCGVGERLDEQRSRERDARERRRRLADMRAALSDEALAALKRCAEEALAPDGVAGTRPGYEVLVKLKIDELLDREYTQDSMRGGREHPGMTEAEPRVF